MYRQYNESMAEITREYLYEDDNDVPPAERLEQLGLADKNGMSKQFVPNSRPLNVVLQRMYESKQIPEPYVGDMVARQFKGKQPDIGENRLSVSCPDRTLSIGCQKCFVLLGVPVLSLRPGQFICMAWLQ